MEQVARERAHSRLSDDNLTALTEAYFEPEKYPVIATLVDIDTIRENQYNLSIPLYVQAESGHEAKDIEHVIEEWKISRVQLKKQTNQLFKSLNELGYKIQNDTKQVADKVSEKPEANIHFKRSVFAAEIIHRLHSEPTFGHVKCEKIIFLAEHLCGVDTGSTYERKAAGPYDSKALRSIDSQIKKQKWYEAKKIEGRYQYQPLVNAGAHQVYFDRYFGDAKEQFDNVLSLFGKWNTERCEIVATLYSAWQDFVNTNEKYDDEKIVNEVINNWHESKKRIPKERWAQALQWMKEHKITPVILI